MYLFIRGSTNPGPRVSRIINYFCRQGKNVVYLSPIRSGDLINKGFRDIGTLGNYDYFDGLGILKYLHFLLAVNFRIAGKIFINRKQIEMVHFSDLEVVLIGAIACKLLGIKFVYNIHDNFYQRYDFNIFVSWLLKYVESCYIALSHKTLVPELFRKSGYPASVHKKIAVLRNFPDFDVSTDYIPFKTGAVKMFYGGWISKNRSIDFYFDLAIELKKKGIGVDFEVCGWGDENYLISLESLFRKHDIGFVYLGQLSQQEAIEYLKKSDVSIAFYNPNKIINILAASNKIPEIIGSNTILITNEQTEIAKSIRPMNISLQFKYDITEVVDGLVELVTDKVAVSEFIKRSKAFYSKEYCPKECRKCLEIVFHEFT